jgi:hypothetical protein
MSASSSDHLCTLASSVNTPEHDACPGYCQTDSIDPLLSYRIGKTDDRWYQSSDTGKEFKVFRDGKWYEFGRVIVAGIRVEKSQVQQTPLDLTDANDRANIDYKFHALCHPFIIGKVSILFCILEHARNLCISILY